MRTMDLDCDRLSLVCRTWAHSDAIKRSLAFDVNGNICRVSPNCHLCCTCS